MSRSLAVGSGPPLPRLVASSLRGALALVAPCDCAGCGAPDLELCGACRVRLRPALEVGALPDGTPLVSALAYEGVVRDVILAFKQEGRFRLARELGPALAAALGEVARVAGEGSAGAAASAAGGASASGGAAAAGVSSVAGGASAVGRASAAGAASGSAEAGAVVRGRGEAIAVLAVPPSRAGRRRRGYDPVDLVVRAAGAVVASPRLAILRRSGSQKSRSRADRLRGRSGTIRCPASWAGRRVVVVDDVSTTGATLLEAVRAARAAGAEVVGACCLAATPLMSAKVP